jgi:hypothetical protein
MTLRDAFLHAATDPAVRTEQMNSNITAWLGSSQKQFDYVYLSEVRLMKAKLWSLSLGTN